MAGIVVMIRPTCNLLKVAFAVALILCTGPVSAQSLEGLTWTEQKCVLYERAVKDAIEFQGPDGLRASFLDENVNFIASGCVKDKAICPVTDPEIQLVNMLTIMTMNEGMASTFVPFGCD